MRKTKSNTTRVTPHVRIVAQLLPTAQNSSQEYTKDFKIPTYVWNLKLFLLIPRDNRNLCQRMFYKLLNPLKAELNPICPLLTLFGAHHIFHVSRLRVKPPAVCWARPRILPQVRYVIPPKIRLFVRFRSCIMKLQRVMLSALTDGPRRLSLRMSCGYLHFCFFTAMTSMKNGVTFKKPWRFSFLSMVTESSWILLVTFKNDKLFGFRCRWERWVVEISGILW
jgi:hypothetical protein